MHHISWADLNGEEQRAIAVLAAGISAQLCEAVALTRLKRFRLVQGTRLTRKGEELRKSGLRRKLEGAQAEQRPALS